VGRSRAKGVGGSPAIPLVEVEVLPCEHAKGSAVVVSSNEDVPTAEVEQVLPEVE
jgi:hypothetical protein